MKRKIRKSITKGLEHLEGQRGERKWFTDVNEIIGNDLESWFPHCCRKHASTTEQKSTWCCLSSANTSQGTKTLKPERTCILADLEMAPGVARILMSPPCRSLSPWVWVEPVNMKDIMPMIRLQYTAKVKGLLLMQLTFLIKRLWVNQKQMDQVEIKHEDDRLKYNRINYKVNALNTTTEWQSLTTWIKSNIQICEFYNMAKYSANIKNQNVFL